MVASATHLFKESPHKRLLLTREAAAMLAISERNLRSMSKSGGIPCVRFGRSVRFDPADLHAWIEGHKVDGPRNPQ